MNSSELDRNERTNSVSSLGSRTQQQEQEDRSLFVVVLWRSSTRTSSWEQFVFFFFFFFFIYRLLFYRYPSSLFWQHTHTLAKTHYSTTHGRCMVAACCKYTRTHPHTQSTTVLWQSSRDSLAFCNHPLSHSHA
jgi:hypothetical protein